jgi:hypothetical protein
MLEMLPRLDQERKRYMGVLGPSDIERLLLEALPLFHQFVGSIFRLAIEEAVQMPEYQAIHKSGRLLIRTGEYMDISENIYVEDQITPSAEEVGERLWEASEDEPFIYENLKQLVMPNLELMNKDLRYNDFSHSELQESRFQSCILTGSRWQHAKLEGSRFYNCLLTDADFRQASLMAADFSQSSGSVYRKNGQRLPGLTGIHFEHSALDGADFTGVTSFEHAYFEGATMQGTKVPRIYEQHWKLSDLQRQSIVWMD